MRDRLSDRTIEDFGRQWSAHTDSEGWYGSVELFRDILHPLLQPGEFGERRVAEIGSGAGRIVAMLLAAGARKVIAVEPSRACSVLRENLRRVSGAERVEVLERRGEELETDEPLDYVISIGVIHHIPEPGATLRAAFDALKPGGKLFVWLYGREGNESYLAVVEPLRRLTSRLPHVLLGSVVRVAYVALCAYKPLAVRFDWPLRAYLERVLWPMTPAKRRLVIYDQLNPAFAKYYTRAEAEALLLGAGFTDVRLHHRHGYSWSVLGTKPEGRG